MLAAPTHDDDDDDDHDDDDDCDDDDDDDDDDAYYDTRMRDSRAVLREFHLPRIRVLV